MRLLRRNEQELVLSLDNAEQQVLRDLLAAYPVLRTDFQPLSKNADPQDAKQQANQQLLVEALAAQKAEYAKLRDQFLASPDRLRPVKRHWELRIAPAEIEWLLQVLNDVRVGNWERAGCPEEEPLGILNVTVKDVHALIIMETAGFFIHDLLENLGGREKR